ncbi:ABC transporter permease subunit [Bacillus spongiae]|uniref:ABC transporter permease subunit n=1 Tax=Bacillus spongiae TaxID=2683610 RepID=A0ABU8HFC8_9BACI
MKQLVKFELYKIFRQKRIYITMFLLFLIFCLVSFSQPFLGYGGDPLDYKDDLQVISHKWEGELNKDKFDEAERLLKIYEEKYSNEAQSEEERAEQYLFYSIGQYDFIVNRIIPERINELNSELLKFNEDEFPYKQALLEKNMLEHLKINTFQYSIGPERTITLVKELFPFFTVFMLIIGLVSIFGNEKKTEMDQILYSTKYGRSKGVTAKIIASFSYVLFVVLSWVAIILVIHTYIYGNHGWNAPIQAYAKFSPYDLTLLEYFMIQIGVLFLVAVAFMMVILAVSAIFKKSLFCFFIISAVFILPIVEVSSPFWHYVKMYSFMNLMTAQEFTKSFHVMNIGGFPVLDPFVHYSFVGMISTIFLVVVYKAIKRTQVM